MRRQLQIVTVVGARPQFIKAAAVSRCMMSTNDTTLTEKIVHSGQHYDHGMSDIFFQELGIPQPWKNLEVGSGTHAMQTARIMIGLEELLLEQRPNVLIVYGDTNSTIAGSLVASKLGIPIAHVEAGLRSYNRTMPEEINRVVADHLASLHFCPSNAAAENLAREGITNNVHVVGDVMRDMVNHYGNLGADVDLSNGVYDSESPFILATIHRAENTDNINRLAGIVGALNEIPLNVIWPVHPRTVDRLKKYGIRTGKIQTIDPISYRQMVGLQQRARLIVTDSGGVQKEAYWLRKPCVTVRDETEWTELVDAGVNVVTGSDPSKILAAVWDFLGEEYVFSAADDIYGSVGASARIVKHLVQWLSTKPDSTD